MANIRVDLTHIPFDGEPVTFKAPCDASSITGLVVYYEDGGKTVSKPYTLTDANGNDIGVLDNIFAKDAIVKAILDTDGNKAFVQNPNTNTYLEGKFKKVDHRYNLLDNSDFRNPVNQKGQNSYKGAGEGINRWECTSNNWMVTVEDGCIMVSDNPDSSSTSTAMVRQTITVPPNLRGKTVTLAARLKGTDVRLNINNKDIGEYAGDDDWYVKVVTGTVPADAETVFVALQCRNMVTWYCEWVALYEGEYTAETLPEYQPKGYNVELLNCGGVTAEYVGALPNKGRVSVSIDALDEDGVWETSTDSTGTFPLGASGAGVLFHRTWDKNYKEQILLSFTSREVYHRTMDSATWKDWKQLATTDYAVNKAGDTMMAGLGLWGGNVQVTGNAHLAQFESRNASGSTSTRRLLQVRNSNGAADVAQALVLDDWVNGVQKTHTVLHTGNLSALGVAKIATGSYVGTGTYGADNPCTLNLDFAPKFVMVYVDNVDTTNGGADRFTAAYPMTKAKRIGRTAPSTTMAVFDNYIWGDNSFAWYTDQADRAQLNESGKTYYYLAIG